MMKVSVNCRSIKPVAAEAPAGSHQVLATKKYVLTNVISQIRTINARPIPQSPWAKKDFPTAVPRPTTQATVGGECITASRRECKQVVHEANPELKHLLQL